MIASRIQADFDDLTAISIYLGQYADNLRGLCQHIQQIFYALEGGGWLGRGAQTFFAEMRQDIFPALDRLTGALDTAQHTTQQINAFLREAEEEASSLFNGQDDRIVRSGKDIGRGLRITGWQKVENPEPFLGSPADGVLIHPNDIDQGAVGDCYLAASLAVLAQNNPQLIEQMIKDNGDGSYTVTLYVSDGKGGSLPHDIRVTPEFPVGDQRDGWFRKPKDLHMQFGDDQTEYNGPKGTNPMSVDRQEVWPQLIEKAYAQYLQEQKLLFGSLPPSVPKSALNDHPEAGYKLLNKGGLPKDALFALTGQESKVYPTISKLSLHDMAEAHRNGQVMIFGTGDTLPFKEMRALAHLFPDWSGELVHRHAFYVTDVDEKGGFVYLRNPWGYDLGVAKIAYKDLDNAFSYLTVNTGTH